MFRIWRILLLFKFYLTELHRAVITHTRMHVHTCVYVRVLIVFPTFPFLDRTSN